ncbi:hypothetical protein N7494_001389 [Penicillium frequentans]|uniref:Glycosyl hydrolase family 13 catalytic domain-containing protein n=1 Tax=Penicillium frequentans TaxID=3151616 RepID=A0AAD6D7Z4_9EURO|nr:hypothetical protein N7494_001389 [Penicillium glabrum]
MQGFEWHVPADQLHWKRLQKALPSLRDIGVDRMWIPPGCKGMDASGIGYDVYDLWDLGEFHQKGSRATRWGPKEHLSEMMQTAQDVGIGICWDTILNHKAGADRTETFQATKVNPEDRNAAISPPENISGWVRFDFSGRKGKYSSMKYHHQHFNGVDWNETRKETAIYKIAGARKDWAKDVSDEHGNYDYLMFANLDHTNPEVRADIFKWSEWIGTELPISGMRIDAAKHYSAAFQRDFVNHLRRTTFVGNHDTQPGQSLETIIIPFFKPIAYGLILLRSQGQPCVFYGDLYGLRGGPASLSRPACSGKLPILMQARKLYAYGEQRDYFDKRHCIGFVRYGTVHYSWGLACVISNTVATYKRMYVGVKHMGEEWTDILDWCIETVIIDHRGYGIFPVAAKSISVWVNDKAKGRKSLARPFDTDIYDL